MVGNDVVRTGTLKICILALVLCLLCACGETTAPTPTATPAPTATAAPTATVAPTPTPAPTATPAPASGSDLPATPPPATDTDLTAAAATAEPTEEPFDPVLPEREPMGDELFADAAFFGNSLVDGLRLFGGLTQGDFYAATSASVVNVGTLRNAALRDGTAATLLDALGETQYGKVYVLLGINEIGFNTDSFIELYGGVLDEIAQREPDAELIIMSLTPVTRNKSDEGPLFSIERVREYNEALLRLAADRGCRYLDLMAALQDEEGYLAEKDAADGIHMQPSKYKQWADCLRSHYPENAIADE